MKILAIESSCDETAAAVTEERDVLSSVVATQIAEHKIYGGVVPEIASRRHTEAISQVCAEALSRAGLTYGDIDAVAVTFAPGLIGALLVGVNFAKGLSMSLKKPLIPVHHLRSHIAANYITNKELKPPFLCLLVSGGNTVLAEVADYTKFKILGGTRDDAAGECFDKSARVLGLPYPGGAPIDRLAKEGRDDAYTLPHPFIGENPYDMSFSGLKTAVINLAHHCEQTGEALDRAGLAASLCRAVSESLVPRTMAAAAELGYKKIAVAGGVAANSRIRADFAAAAEKAGAQLFVPPLRLCGDNAAMIGCQGYYEFLAGHTAGPELNAYATMPLEKQIG